MSLLRRIHLLLTLVLLLVTAGSWLVHVAHSRAQLSANLQLQGAQLANNLLAPHAGLISSGQWAALWQSMAAQAGDAQLVLDAPGQQHWQTDLQPQAAGAPEWFRRLYPIADSELQQTLSASNGQNARLQLTISAAPAYAELWRSGWHFVAVSSLLLVLVLAFTHWRLRRELAPLEGLAVMARRLARNEPTPPLPLPACRELREVVINFNRMTDAVHHCVEELQQRVDLWRKSAFADEDTGLPNRRALADELASRLADPQSGHGMLMVIRLNRRGLHAARGFGVVTAIWQQLLKELPQLAHGIRHQSYRAREEELVLLLPHGAEAQIKALAERIHQWLLSHDDEDIHDGLGWIGVSLYSAGDTLNQVLAEMDLAVEQAVNSGRNAWVLHTGQRRLPLALLNIEERKTLVDSVISERRFDFCQHPVLHCASRQVLYQEWLPQFHDSRGSAVASRTLVSLARQFDRLPELELTVVEAMASFLRNLHPRPQLALNIDPLSLLQGPLVERLKQLCQQDPQLPEHLLLELDERRLVGAGQQLAERLEPLVAQGARVVVDHFGAEHASFTLLTTLRPAFIKLDGRIGRALHQHPDHLLFLQTLLPVCDRLAIGVIAGQVENEIDLHGLERAGLKLAQGFVYGQPRPLATTINARI